MLNPGPDMSTIAVLGTLDTKGEEHAYVAECIRKRGHDALLIDVGSLGEPQIAPDITRDEVAAAGGVDLTELSAKNDRGVSVAAMSRSAPHLLLDLLESGRISGVISLGGGGGTSIATGAMRALPIGFPKVMVSTLAAGNVEPYVGTKDIVMIPSVVDVAGLNRISRKVFTQAAGAVCGMVEADIEEGEGRPIIVASQFGNTTACVDEARRILEERGFEVLVFHATGAGGRSMESIIESGLVAGVLDITTTEWADEVLGGMLSAGPDRLDAAARLGVPAIISPGCLDMANFASLESLPSRMKGRLLYEHNPNATLVRTSPEEGVVIGQRIAARLNESTGPVTVLLPIRAISVIGTKGQPFHDPAADQALFKALRENLRADIVVKELDLEINDPAFAASCVEALLENMGKA